MRFIHAIAGGSVGYAIADGTQGQCQEYISYAAASVSHQQRLIGERDMSFNIRAFSFPLPY